MNRTTSFLATVTLIISILAIGCGGWVPAAVKEARAYQQPTHDAPADNAEQGAVDAGGSEESAVTPPPSAGHRRPTRRVVLYSTGSQVTGGDPWQLRFSYNPAGSVPQRYAAICPLTSPINTPDLAPLGAWDPSQEIDVMVRRVMRKCFLVHAGSNMWLKHVTHMSAPRIRALILLFDEADIDPATDEVGMTPACYEFEVELGPEQRGPGGTQLRITGTEGLARCVHAH